MTTFHLSEDQLDQVEQQLKAGLEELRYHTINAAASDLKVPPRVVLHVMRRATAKKRWRVPWADNQMLRALEHQAQHAARRAQQQQQSPVVNHSTIATSN